MSPDALPEGYPDSTSGGLVRVSDIEFLEFELRMTLTLGERFVQIWELEEGVPARWFGNAFRVHTDAPGLYLSYEYDQALDRYQRDRLAGIAAKFWAP
ncbi:hypothetical protein [Glycomyces harbinensis]|uniref:Uncharacterized protein n=1 Tax=Glycomyces harbinensis TaxID=58114 RepID=A0A1G6TNM7_9ACTN|nr:hypothetical protein [Glycomyces harbinensis]SDD30703.1 hypothetical protein SAMN05216270_10371 [Glycomyces harbinensis]